MTLILRLYSYLYHLVLALIFVALGVIAYASGSHTLKLPMLPWEGEELSGWLFWGGVAGLVSIVLAVSGRFRFLFPVWALAILTLMVRGFLLRAYSFASADQFYWVLALITGALGAFLASLTLFKPRRVRRQS